MYFTFFPEVHLDSRIYVIQQFFVARFTYHAGDTHGNL